MESKIAHLGFIQGAVNRMGNNAFLVKGWTVALVAAIFALASKEADAYFLVVAGIAIFVFWFLDVYYLRQEHLYRALYLEVSAGRIESDIFTMNTTPVENKVRSEICLAFSKSVFPFYALVFALFFFFFSKNALWEIVLIKMK